jgi:methionine sulfoxide reductase heme-binding subunit
VKSDPTFWLLARASGLTAYALLTGTVVAGLVHKSRARNVLDLHRFLPLLAFGMLALHGFALVLDRTVHIPLAGLVVPGASPYRPVAVASGVLACELMVLVAVSFSLRRRIGFRNWRRLHWLTYFVFFFATAHGIAAGTDTTRPWAQNLYLAAVGAVVFATAWRALARPALERRT